MRNIRRQRAHGFTLIELMIVVAIVGVLGALGVYGVRRYLIHSKTAEAFNGVGQIAMDAKTAYERESMQAATLKSGSAAKASNNLCLSATTQVPTSVSVVAGRKWQSTLSEWLIDQGTPGVGFSCLKFTMSDPQYYVYNYQGSSGSTGTFTAMANGDLDNNGTTSTFQLFGSITSGSVFVSPTFRLLNPDE
jgi:type IV pilus assembly protein PilA